MEVAVIDWKSLDSRFVKDELYEHINAPQWVDFAAPVDPIDDETWFCRPDCNHPKTVEDFFKNRTPTSKRSVSVSEIHLLGERNRRDATLKKRGQAQQQPSSVENSENRNPNFSTPPNYKSSNNKFTKEAFKSSAERKAVDDRKEPPTSLRRTLSARNLFGGGDILNRITEFCNDLKRLATRAKEREDAEKQQQEEGGRERCDDDVLRGIDDDNKEKDRTPLLAVAKAKIAAAEKNGLQEKPRRKKRFDDDEENNPISIDVNKAKSKKELQIRTSPPTPQCFSANNRVPTNATPPTAFKSKPLERGILKELAQSSNKDEKKDYGENKTTNNDIRGKQPSSSSSSSSSIVAAEKEARALDVFWFLKPCTLSS